MRVGEAFCWIEKQEVINLRAVARDGEPLGLNAEQARKLGGILQRLATTLEQLEADREG